MSDDDKKKETVRGEFSSALKKRFIDITVGGIGALVVALLVARFSPLWHGLVAAWQRDAGEIQLDVPEYMYLGGNLKFDPLIVPKSSTIMHSTLIVKLWTDSVQVNPAMQEFTIADVSKAVHLSDVWKDSVQLAAAHEGPGVIELQLVSGDRPLARIVKAIPVRSRFRGKWRFKLDDQDGEMDAYQSDNDVFGTYAIDGGGFGSFLGRVDAEVFQATFTDSKTVKRWYVNAPVEQRGEALSIGMAAPTIARLFTAKDNGWVQTGTTAYSATKSN